LKILRAREREHVKRTSTSGIEGAGTLARNSIRRRDRARLVEQNRLEALNQDSAQILEELFRISRDAMDVPMHEEL